MVDQFDFDVLLIQAFDATHSGIPTEVITGIGVTI